MCGLWLHPWQKTVENITWHTLQNQAPTALRSLQSAKHALPLLARCTHPHVLVQLLQMANRAGEGVRWCPRPYGTINMA